MAMLWLVGDFAATTAGTLLQVVAAVPDTSLRHLAAPEMAAEFATESADFVLVVQHRPREFSRSGISSLIASQPLARLIVGLGPWCASSARSENAWPESVVVPLDELGQRFVRDVQRSLRHEGYAPSLTSGRDELFLASRNPILAPLTGPIWVDSPDLAFSTMLREIASEISVEASIHPEKLPTLLWDADPLEFRLPMLLRHRGRAGRIIAFASSATPEVAHRLEQAGADQVLGKPFDLASLYQSLRCER